MNVILSSVLRVATTIAVYRDIESLLPTETTSESLVFQWPNCTKRRHIAASSIPIVNGLSSASASVRHTSTI